MRPIARRYAHFLLALVVALIAAFPGAFPGLLALGLPGTEDNRITMDLVWLGLAPGTCTAVPAFWAVGRRPPLRASFGLTALAGVGAALGLSILLRVAARTAWLTGDGAMILAFALMATLGFLPFAWATDLQGRPLRGDLPWRGRA